MSNLTVTGADAPITLADLKAANLIPAGANDAQARMFAQLCADTGLDPRRGEIYLLEMQGKFTNMVSQAGLLKVAHHTGQLVSIGEPVFNRLNDGSAPEQAALSFDQVVTASVDVVRISASGERVTYTATVRKAEFVNQRSPTWQRMPFVMLGKVATAHALRRAFPQLSALYEESERDAFVATAIAENPVLAVVPEFTEEEVNTLALELVRALEDVFTSDEANAVLVEFQKANPRFCQLYRKQVSEAKKTRLELVAAEAQKAEITVEQFAAMCREKNTQS